MSLYARYIKEHRGDSIVEFSNGFATYRYLDDFTVYIVDIYVLPEDRKSDVASALADQICTIAKLRGCKTLKGTVDVNGVNPTTSIAVLIGYGMKFDCVNGNLLVFSKEIK